MRTNGPERYRRKTVARGQCEFSDVLRSTFAAVVAIGHADKIDEYIEESAAREQVDMNRDREGLARWQPWLCKKSRIGEVETSGLGRVFWELGYRDG